MDQQNNSFARANIHQFEFLTAGETKFNQLIFEAVSKPLEKPLLLANYNLHGLYLALIEPAFKRYLQFVEYAWIDGFPIVWLLRLTGHKIDKNLRITFLDWQNSFFRIASDRESSIYLLGSNSQVIQKSKIILQQRHPRVRFFAHHGYFDMTDNLPGGENSRIIERINTAAPDILLVGMGMPRQEKWILNNAQHLKAKVIMPIGGYFDYIAGHTKTPNRFISNLGLEWLLRFCNEPIRLFRRYMVEPWYVMFRLLKYHWIARK